jgi:hypothetical protein
MPILAERSPEGSVPTEATLLQHDAASKIERNPVMRMLTITLLTIAGICGAGHAAQAQQSSCKVCSDQQRACMKNYAGPTCETEYQMCLKSCGKKS